MIRRETETSHRVSKDLSHSCTCMLDAVYGRVCQAFGTVCFLFSTAHHQWDCPGFLDI